MKHPNKEQQENQKKFLETIPEEQREEHALLLRFGNASYSYHQGAQALEPSEDDYKEWLEGLRENIRRDMEIKGFEGCKGVVSFTRYVNEKNDIGMLEWMKNNLSAEDFKAYGKLIEGRKALD